jgi:hypothetical protein
MYNYYPIVKPSEILKKMYNDKKKYDLKIETLNGTINTNKRILSIENNYFKNIIKNNKNIKINININILKEIIKFMFIREFSFKNKEELIKCFLFCNKICFKDMEKECLLIIFDNIKDFNNYDKLTSDLIKRRFNDKKMIFCETNVQRELDILNNYNLITMKENYNYNNSINKNFHLLFSNKIYKIINFRRIYIYPIKKYKNFMGEKIIIFNLFTEKKLLYLYPFLKKYKMNEIFKQFEFNNKNNELKNLLIIELSNNKKNKFYNFSNDNNYKKYNIDDNNNIIMIKKLLRNNDKYKMSKYLISN